MAWEKNLPADDTELRLGPSYQRGNWEAIESAEITLGQVGVNLAKQAGDLALNANTYRLFSKEDASSTFTELFGINSNGDVTQLTYKTGNTVANGYTYLPGRVLMQWGRTGVVGDGDTVTFPIKFGANAYSVTLTPISPDISTWGVLGTPTDEEFVVAKAIGTDRQIFWQAIGPA